MNISIRKRIYGSFFLLVMLFVVNGIITIITLYRNQKLSDHLSNVIDPSLQAMNDFTKMMVESKMYSTNWVFLRSEQNDKNALLKIQNIDYAALKARLNTFSLLWKDQLLVDSLDKVYDSFEKLLLVEKGIMHSLTRFENYDDPAIKLEAERVIEDEVIPQTAGMMNGLRRTIDYCHNIRMVEGQKLDESYAELRTFIIFLAITIICIGLILSFYLTRVIITPINKIKNIVNDLGKGITRRLNYHDTRDEIGEMVLSVNNLSENLQRTALFAQEVGARNFEMLFEPLSNEDTLGKALVAMRDNLEKSEKELLAITEDVIQRNKDLQQFTYIVSHNLRAPVANIMGISNLLNNAAEEEHATKNGNNEFLKGLSVSVNKLDGIILDLNDILNIKNPGFEKKEKVFFSSLVADITSSINHIIQKEQVIIISDFLAAEYIFTLKSYIYSIFYNLILNSIKYHQPGLPPLIEIKSSLFNNNIQLTFTDNGKGFDVKKNGADIFGLYKRFDTSVEGKGIGLFMVKTEVETLGGNITLQSVVNKGTQFIIKLPVTNEQTNKFFHS